MKKMIALLLVLTLLLAGCGGSGGSIKESVQSGTVTPVTTAPTEAETEPAAEPVPEDNFSLGGMVGGVYENTYVGYGCSLDENWTYKTAEELQDLSDLTQGMLEGSDVGDRLSKYPSITDMMAENMVDYTSINVLYSYLTPTERIAQALLTNDDMIDATLDQKETLISAYQQAGIDVLEMQKVTVTFLGEERSAIHTHAITQDIDYYILQVMDINLGAYSVTLTLGSFLEDNTMNLLDLFYSVN